MFTQHSCWKIWFSLSFCPELCPQVSLQSLQIGQLSLISASHWSFPSALHFAKTLCLEQSLISLSFRVIPPLPSMPWPHSWPWRQCPMSDLIPFFLCTSYSLKHYHASLFCFLLFSAESILNLYYGGDNFSFVTFTSLHTCSRQSVMLSNSLRVIFNPFTTTHFKTVSAQDPSHFGLLSEIWASFLWSKNRHRRTSFLTKQLYCSVKIIKYSFFQSKFQENLINIHEVVSSWNLLFGLAHVLNRNCRNRHKQVPPQTSQVIVFSCY